MLRHSFDSSWYSSLGITDMREFASANPLVSDIIYIQKNGGKVLACKNYIYKSNDEYYFSINHKALKIPVGKYCLLYTSYERFGCYQYLCIQGWSGSEQLQLFNSGRFV